MIPAISPTETIRAAASCVGPAKESMETITAVTEIITPTNCQAGSRGSRNGSILFPSSVTYVYR